MMRILCINYEYPPIGGGGASACKGLLESFTKQGHVVDLVTSGMPGLPTFEIINGVNIHRVNCYRKHKHFTQTLELVSQVIPSYRKAIELIEQNDYDINHTHFIVPSGLVSYLIKRKTGLNYVLTAHGSDVAGYNPDRFTFMHHLMAPLWRIIVRNSRVLTAPSVFLKHLIHNTIDTPVDVVPNGFDIEPVQSVEKKNIILVVTRMFERKGVQHLINALHGVKTDWETWIVGDGPYLPTLKQLAQDLDVSVKFFGQVPNDQVFEYYQKSKIYVFPSSVENFPVVLLEAMAAGCAVVTTTAPGCLEVVGEAAVKVEPENVQSLRSALLSLMESPEKLKELGQQGQKRVNQFAWSVVSNRFINVFKTVIESNKPDTEVDLQPVIVKSDTTDVIQPEPVQIQYRRRA